MTKPCAGNRLLLAIAFLFPGFVIAQPVINKVTPLSGPLGSTVTITGSNFSATPAGNIVWFGSVQAPVTAASSGSLTVTVPPGAAYLPITVTAGNLSSLPYKPFITTFSDPGEFNAQAFSTLKTIRTGSGPQSIFSIDLDGDGKPDLVIADGDSNIISVFHNNSTPGTASFTLQHSYILDGVSYPIGVTAGDLDGDGKPDIVVSNYYSQTITIFLNNSSPGNISLDTTELILPAGDYTTAASIADLNGDGKPEIVVANSGDDSLTIYANASTPGNLSFPSRLGLQLPVGSGPFKVGVADIDGDGMPDLATGDAGTNLVSVFRNTGAAGGPLSFAANTDFPTGNNPDGVAIGDLDGDGKPDLVVVNYGDTTLSLLRNTGSSGNISFATQPAVPTGVEAYDLVLSDLDGDGLPDLAVDDQSNVISIHRNTSTPGAISISANTDYPAGDVPFSITTADYDGDGMPDLATADFTANTITVLLNKPANQPAITSFTPNVGIHGTVVTITGVNLAGATGVSFGDSAAGSFTIVSSTTITATVDSGASGAITVVTPNGTATLAGFTFGVPPVINYFTPTSGPNDAIIVLNGKGFTGTTALTFGGAPAKAFTVESDTLIYAVVGVGSSGAVSITTPAGTTSLGGFTYLFQSIPPVQLTAFSPTSAGPGADITITGQNLSGITTISFGGTPVQSFRILSDTVIDATLGMGSSGDLVVNGNNGTGSLPGFVYLAPPPPPSPISLSSFSPSSGATGTTISISGHHLTPATSVRFGGVEASSFAVISDSLILAAVNTGATGEVTVSGVSTADSLPGFLYVVTRQEAPPAIFQLQQFSGAFSGGYPLLQWQTINDGVISYYALERAIDGDTTQFDIIMTASPGDSSYSFIDSAYNQGVNYYRLRMQDTTALYSYSQIIAVHPPGNASMLALYPNPVKYGFTNVTLPDDAGASWFRLVDMYGRIMRTQYVAAGNAQVRIDLSGIIPGVYKLDWTNGKRTAYQTILVLPPY